MTRHFISCILVLLLAMSLSLGCSKNPSEATAESLCDLGKGIYGGTEEIFYKGVCLDEVKAFVETSDSETFITFATCVHEAESRKDFRACAKQIHKARVAAQSTKMVAMGKSLGEKNCQCETFRKARDKKGWEACRLEQKKLKKAFGDEVDRMQKKNPDAEVWQMGKPLSGAEMLDVMKAARDAKKDAGKACKANQK